ncbi:alpha/beta hydrolase [Haloferula helveola]|uniref:Alpha/beta hydrolase n=1 Tax=Haloferula helveola TaxID=490095 RepID=A0ABM7RDQ5_9BACT|nr:alpha/beta hydrolase [Haloferula helveola]
MLLHGLGTSTFTFRELGPILGKTRKVVAIDLNGFGLTERPEASDAYSLAGQAAMVCGVLDELGIREADWVGHSYSGYLSMRIARDSPERVRRLVLVSPALRMEVAPDSFIRSRVLREAVYPGLRLILDDKRRFRALLEPAYHRKEVLTDDVLETYRQQLRIEGLHDAYRGFGASLDDLSRDRVEIAEIDMPVRVIAGRHDAIIPLQALKTSLAESKGRVELRVLESSGHSAPEEQPEALAVEISDFLDRR